MVCSTLFKTQNLTSPNYYYYYLSKVFLFIYIYLSKQREYWSNIVINNEEIDYSFGKELKKMNVKIDIKKKIKRKRKKERKGWKMIYGGWPVMEKDVKLLRAEEALSDNKLEGVTETHKWREGHMILMSISIRWSYVCGVYGVGTATWGRCGPEWHVS